MTYLPPRAGDLRHTFKVERHETTSDGMGGVEGVWKPLVLRVNAKVTAERGGEEVRSARLSGVSRFDIVTRFSLDMFEVGTGDRLVDLNDGTIYNIKWVGSIDGRNRFLHFYCETGGLVDES